MPSKNPRNERAQILDDDLRRIRVAAADKESIEFELDSATLVLEEAITEAIDHGQDLSDVAATAELPVEKVIDIVEHAATPTEGQPQNLNTTGQ